MADENPFASPQLDAGAGCAAPFPVLRLTISGMLLAVGCLLLLLMNGQHFTNRVAFLLLATVSGLLWVLPAARKDNGYGSLSRGIVAVHLAIVAAMLWGLPAAYESQRRFNDSIQKLRARPGQFDSKL